MVFEECLHVSPSSYRKQRQRSAQASREAMLKHICERVETLEHHVGLNIKVDKLASYSRTELLTAKSILCSHSRVQEPEVEQSPEKSLSCFASGEPQELAPVGEMKIGPLNFQGDPYATLCGSLDNLMADMCSRLYNDGSQVQEDGLESLMTQSIFEERTPLSEELDFSSWHDTSVEDDLRGILETLTKQWPSRAP